MNKNSAKVNYRKTLRTTFAKVAVLVQEETKGLCTSGASLHSTERTKVKKLHINEYRKVSFNLHQVAIQ